MIVTMARVRILGPRRLLPQVLDALQDLEVIHIAEPPDLGQPPRAGRSPGAEGERETPARGIEVAADKLRRRVDALAWVLAHLPDVEDGWRPGRRGGDDEQEAPAEIVRRLRRVLVRIEEREEALGSERARVTRMRDLLAAFEGLEELRRRSTTAHAYFLILEDGQEREMAALRAGLGGLLGDGFELVGGPEHEGQRAAVLLVPASRTEEVERLLAEAGIEEMPLATWRQGGADGPPEERLARIAGRLEALRGRQRRLGRRYRRVVQRSLAAAHDRLLALEARARTTRSAHAFVLQGWIPEATLPAVRRDLTDRLGDTVVVEVQDREAWEGEPAPVVLSNPRLFRPFEAITRMLPLPRYGSIDPTPFVAVFFPMFFGVIVGDVAYGVVLAILAVALRRGSRPDSLRRSIAEIAGACSLFTIIFGFLYGELAGDLGRRLFGLHPILLDREEALIPFLALAVALGLVQVVLGLVLGAISAFRSHRKESLGRGLSAAMLILVTLALLAAVEVLPGRFFTPAVIALLAAFPVLVIVEGFLGPLELLSTIGNVLSYARIMALGTASVMMAVVANRLAGAVGGILVGVLFGLLFHLVNFGLALFGPTIHGLRLHYVEFFGKFFSPGGVEYRPFGHWRPEEPTALPPDAARAARSGAP